jgi:hypothetical protein
VNCCWLPGAMLGAIGVIAIEARVAAGTVKVTGFDVKLPRTAVIVVLPAVIPVAKPLDPDALLIDATTADEEAQVAVVVKTWVELSD